MTYSDTLAKKYNLQGEASRDITRKAIIAALLEAQQGGVIRIPPLRDIAGFVDKFSEIREQNPDRTTSTASIRITLKRLEEEGLIETIDGKMIKVNTDHPLYARTVEEVNEGIAG